jgi:uncharacterized protein YciI
MPAQPPRLKDVPRNLKGYFLCLLKKGEKWNETEGSAELMPQHLAFLRQQMESRRFVVTGPVLGEGDDLVGVSVIEAASAQEALELANEDPAVKAGRLRMEIRLVYLPSLDGVRVEF